jgi:hypothetical protein
MDDTVKLEDQSIEVKEEVYQMEDIINCASDGMCLVDDEKEGMMRVRFVFVYLSIVFSKRCCDAMSLNPFDSFIHCHIENWTKLMVSVRWTRMPLMRQVQAS